MMEVRHHRISESCRSEEDYVAQVLKSASSDAIARIFSSPPAVDPKIYYRDSFEEQSINSAQTLI